jgi:hypothetical protein
MTTVKEPPNGSKSPSFFRSVVDDLTKIVIPSKQRERGTPLKPLPQCQVAPSAHDPSNSTFAASRCEYTFSDGRRCRNQRAQLCGQHTLKAKAGHRARSSALEVPALEALCSDLTTATNINRALAQTFLLMAQGPISRKDAVAFGYLSQLLLQSVSGVRAEFAAFGYRQWENKLKTSLMPNADDDPEPSPGGDNIHSAASSSKSDDQARTVIPNERSERGIPPKPFPVNNSSVDEQPLSDPFAKPDYGSLLRRSLDLLDRKYDYTPEGRCEANKLALELELMKPAPAKPAKDFFGQTVALVRRFRDADKQKSGAAAVPPALDYYGHPIQTHVVPPPEAQRSCPPSASDPADFVAPPSRRHRKHRSHSSAPGSPPHSEIPFSLSISATPAKHDSVGGPDADHHEGHRTDWYAPPSWSKTRPPDPCPSRKEKLQRKIRGMTNSAFRRMQHQNARGFWNKGLQKLTP